MKKLLLLIVFLSATSVFSQEDAWVYFKDKPSAQTYLDNPLTMLTQRALDRRTQQGIALDTKDAPIEQTYIDQITASTGITVKAKSKWLNCLHIRGSQTDINALTGLSFVERVNFADASLNAKMSVSKPFKPVNKQMGVETTFNYGTSQNQIQMLNGHLLHQQNYTGIGKIIAVLDAGFPGVNTVAPFQRLRDNAQILGGYDFVGRSTNFYSGNQHGTEVLSTMGGFVDNQLVGTAPDASYYLFITEDNNSENPVEESYWVEAAEEADRLGVDVINSSLGYFEYDNPNYSHTYADMTGNTNFASQGANIAFSRGMILVVSAGNEGATGEPHVGVPAEATNVLAIGAVKSNRSYASFSSIGPSFDGRIKPDVMAQGQNSVLANSSGAVTTASGTSFSGPIMAGMIASFWGALPNLTNQQIIDLVKQSADNYSTPNEQYGYGIPDFQLALNNALGTPQFTNNQFIISPNPTKNAISISFPNNVENVNVSFYNTLGQTILEQKLSNQNTTVSLDNLNSGMYLYKIQSTSFMQSGKIIKE